MRDTSRICRPCEYLNCDHCGEYRVWTDGSKKLPECVKGDQASMEMCKYCFHFTRFDMFVKTEKK